MGMAQSDLLAKTTDEEKVIIRNWGSNRISCYGSLQHIKISKDNLPHRGKGSVEIVWRSITLPCWGNGILDDRIILKKFVEHMSFEKALPLEGNWISAFDMLPTLCPDGARCSSDIWRNSELPKYLHWIILLNRRFLYCFLPKSSSPHLPLPDGT